MEYDNYGGNYCFLFASDRSRISIKSWSKGKGIDLSCYNEFLKAVLSQYVTNEVYLYVLRLIPDDSVQCWWLHFGLLPHFNVVSSLQF